LCLSYRVKWD